MLPFLYQVKRTHIGGVVGVLVFYPLCRPKLRRTFGPEPIRGAPHTYPLKILRLTFYGSLLCVWHIRVWEDDRERAGIVVAILASRARVWGHHMPSMQV